MSSKKRYFIIHKPFKILSQFKDEGNNKGLGSIYSLPKDVYPIGRLDLDSEGMLILTNDKKLNHRLLNPKFKHQRTYWVEVDGKVDISSMQILEKGITININGKLYKSSPCKVKLLNNIEVPERSIPVNYKKHPVRTWLEMQLTEGKNRQIRKMTAKVGHPTLRLIRVGIEDVLLGNLASGEIREISQKTLLNKLKILSDD